MLLDRKTHVLGMMGRSAMIKVIVSAIIVILLAGCQTSAPSQPAEKYGVLDDQIRAIQQAATPEGQRSALFAFKSALVSKMKPGESGPELWLFRADGVIMYPAPRDRTALAPCRFMVFIDRTGRLISLPALILVRDTDALSLFLHEL
ncbi:MAG TPA: hypothetical protein VEH27_15635 [Methylomirabilota bacterium]|nr:hypothetical protein [Methylomirabilota bacterium]